jgi:8-oxo-dGTP pyrophosphatase MutT (NUDIX family)
MLKFSKLKPKDEFKEPGNKIIFDGEWVKVIDYEGWSIIKEKDLVVCIPYFIETSQFLIRYEYIPTYKYTDGKEYHITVLSGGIERGESPEKALFRELEEEAGIVLRDDYIFEGAKPIFINKCHVNKYHPFIIPLNQRDYHEIVPPTDGSVAEKMSKSVKVDIKYINNLVTSDLITDYMLLKLKEYLNIN